MTYKTTKINGINQDQSNNIDISLEDLITISNPVDNQFLVKQQSNWSTVSGSSLDPEGVYSIYPLYNYNVSLYWYEQDDNYIIYKPKEYYKSNNLTYVDASGSNVPVSNSNWFKSITLSGQYFLDKTVIIEASISPYAYTSAIIEAQIIAGSNPIGPPAMVIGQGYSDTLFGRYVGDGNDIDISIKLRYLNGSTQAFLAGSGHHFQESLVIKVY